MAIYRPPIDYFVVDTEAEKNTGLQDGANVFVKATNTFYILKNKEFIKIGSGGSGGSSIGSDTVVSETSYGQSSAPGASDNYARGDHTHGTPKVSSFIRDTNYDTKVQTEESADEDIIRFDANGTEVAAIDVNGLAMIADKPVIFDGLGNNTKIKWNSGSLYLELYIQNTLRVEF